MAKTRKRTRTKKEEQPLVSPLIIGVIIGAAFLIVGGLILLGVQQNTPTSLQPTNLDDFPTKGDPNAPVTIVEYSDFGCSHCQSFVLNTVAKLDENYIETGKVKYIVHPFHLGNPEIAFATEAAWCMADQDKFFEYQYTLFENQGMVINQQSLANLAENVGGDKTAFAECLSNRTHQDAVENARRAGLNRGISSTPTFFINGQMVRGNQPYEDFQQMIEQFLATAQ